MSLLGSLIQKAQQRASQVYDQVNPLDNGLSYQNRQINPNVQPQSVARQAVRVVQPVANMTGVPAAIDAARLATAEATHNQAAAGAATQRLATNLPQFLPIAIAESVKPFAQSVATTVLSPYANHVANQQAGYARRTLNGNSGNPAHDAAVEAYANSIKQDFYRQQLAQNGINPNDSNGTITRKVAGQAGSAAANIAMAGAAPGALATRAAPALARNAAFYGGASAAAGAAQTAQMDDPTIRDYLKNTAEGAAMGAAVPALGYAAHAALPAAARAGSASQAANRRLAAGDAGGYIRVSDGKNLDPGTIRDNYGAGHSPTKDYSSPAYDISDKGNFVPADIYTHPEYYSNVRGSTADPFVKASLESHQVVGQIRNKPNADVTIYRAAPKDELNNGDWVTLSKTYADQHASQQGTKVHAYKVKANELRWPGDDINEFGFFGKKTSRLALNQSGHVGSDEAPTYAKATDQIHKEGGFAGIDKTSSLPAKNRYAADELASTLGLNPKFLYEQATAKGIDLLDHLQKLDSGKGDAVTSSNDLMAALNKPTKNLTSSLDAQKYATFDSFYKDYKSFFDGQGIKPEQAQTIYNDAQHAPVAISKSGTARTAAELQAQIEAAHNAGDTALEAKLNAQLPDPAMSSTPAAMTPERRAELMAKMRGGQEHHNPFALDQRGAIQVSEAKKQLPASKKTADTGKLGKPAQLTDFKQEVKPRKFSGTVFGSENTKLGLQKEMLKRNNSYNVKHNPKLISESRAYVKKNPDEARKFTLDAKNSATNPDKVVTVGSELIKLHQSRGEFGLAADVADKTAANLTEYGRGVQAASLYSRISPAGIVRYAAKISQEGGKKLDATTTEQLTKMSNEVAKMPDGEGKAAAVHRMLELARSQNPSPLTKQLIDVWKAGLLTAPTTHLGNIASNSVEALTRDALVNPLATGIDMATSIVTGKRSRTLTPRGGAGGFGEGLKRGGTYIKTGYDPRNPLNKYELDNKTVFGKGVLGKAASAYTESVFRILGAADQPFYYHTLRNSLQDRAGAAAKNAGIRGEAKTKFVADFIKEPPAEALTGAVEDAKRSVFGNKTLLGSAASMIKRPTSIKVGGKDVKSSGALGNFVVPFSQVPASIATRILERSPVGYVQAAGDIVRGIKNGNFDQRAFTEHVANATVGTGTAFIVGKALSDQNMITLGYPPDQKEAARWKAERKTPYSIKVGNKWRSLNYIQPFGSILAYGAAYSQARQNGQSVTQATATAAAQAGKSVTGQSFLQGVSGTLQAIQDPEQKAEKFLNSTAGSLIPNAIRSFAAAQDNKQRQVNNVPDAVQNGVPFYRRNLQPVVDTYGRDVTRPSGPGAGGAADRYLNPIRTSVDASTNVTKEVDRLHATDPQNTKMDVQPIPVGKTLSFGGNKTSLTDKQRTDLQRQVGQATNTAWSQLIQTSEYKALDDQQKVKALNQAQDDAVSVTQRKFANANKIDTSGAQKLSSSAQSVQYGGKNISDYATKQADDAKLAQFKNSDQKTLQMGQTYYFKDGQGKVQSMPKAEYDFNQTNSKLSLQMDNARASKDVTTWLNLANQQYQALESKKKLYDPTTQADKINSIILQQQNLSQEAAKYQGYGGFTKGPKAKKALKAYTGSNETISAFSKISRANTDAKVTKKSFDSKVSRRSIQAYKKPASQKITSRRA